MIPYWASFAGTMHGLFFFPFPFPVPLRPPNPLTCKTSSVIPHATSACAKTSLSTATINSSNWVVPTVTTHTRDGAGEGEGDGDGDVNVSARPLVRRRRIRNVHGSPRTDLYVRSWSSLSSFNSFLIVSSGLHHHNYRGKRSLLFPIPSDGNPNRVLRRSVLHMTLLSLRSLPTGRWSVAHRRQNEAGIVR